MGQVGGFAVAGRPPSPSPAVDDPWRSGGGPWPGSGTFQPPSLSPGPADLWQPECGASVATVDPWQWDGDPWAGGAGLPGLEGPRGPAAAAAAGSVSEAASTHDDTEGELSSVDDDGPEKPLLDNAHSQAEAPVAGASLPHDKQRPFAPKVRCDNRGCGQYEHWKKIHE